MVRFWRQRLWEGWLSLAIGALLAMIGWLSHGGGRSEPMGELLGVERKPAVRRTRDPGRGARGLCEFWIGKYYSALLIAAGVARYPVWKADIRL